MYSFVALGAVIAVGLILTGVVSLLSNRRFHRLSVRIALVILVTGPIVLVAFLGLNALYYGWLQQPTPRWTQILQALLLVFGTPLLLGLVTSRLISRPLRDFTRALRSVRDDNYRTILPSSRIYEFDQVFGQLNELTRRLRHEEELRRNLISDTSHELNTPLSAMLGQLTAMEDGVLAADPARLRLLREQTERLADLVEQLDEYTRARSAPPDATEDVDVADLYREVDTLLGPRLAERGMTLHLAETPAGLVLHASRRILHRVLTSLVSNAVRHSGGTEVHIEVTARRLVVRDNGRGVPADSMPYLFERFFRVDASRSRDTGGLGLGLAIVRELALRQGWRISTADAAPGLAVLIDL
ncbi:MAG: HAMP domain-containing sensor histidine kinase [Actinocatenispora sp.]